MMVYFTFPWGFSQFTINFQEILINKNTIYGNVKKYTAYNFT